MRVVANRRFKYELVENIHKGAIQINIYANGSTKCMEIQIFLR